MYINVQAIELIQKHGFDIAYEIAFNAGEFETCKQIRKIEFDIFGSYNGAFGTSQFSICSNPVRLDLYRGCGFGCTYCFAENNHNDYINYSNPQYVVGKIDRVFNGKLNDAFAVMVREGWPVHIGGMSDPLPCREKYTKATFSAIEAIAKHNHPIVLSTKSNLPLHNPEYVSLFADIKDNFIFQMSLITAKHHRQFERFAPSPQDRIKTVGRLCSSGINVMIRLQPFIWQLLEEQNELFKIYADIGVKGVIVESIKVSRGQSNINLLKNAFLMSFGIDMNTELVEKFQGNNTYSFERKYQYNKILRDIAHANNLLYFAADNDFRFMGDSPNCCGTDLIKANVNDTNLTHLAYRYPDDFGYHLIKDVDNRYMQLKCDENGFIKPVDTVKNVLRKIYNKFECDTFERIYTDSDNNVHYRIKPEYRT